MKCFNPYNRSLSPTRQNIRSILTDTENLHAEIEHAFNNNRPVGDIFVNSGNLLVDLRRRMRNQSGEDPNVFRNRFSRIQNDFNVLLYPISHLIKNHQSGGKTGLEK